MVMRPPETLLKTQQVAEALGVSVSTIKRWVDSGALGATRTVGKHRLIPLGEAIRFARGQDLPHAGLEALLGLGQAKVAAVDDRLRDALATALKRGRSAEARSLIVQGYAAAGGAAGLADDLLRPAMERVGHDWDLGTLDIYQEHRASRIVEVALGELIGRVSARPTRATAPLAMGAAPPGDHYTISGLLCELALRELGWEVSNLGPDLPLESLARATRAQRPRLVWLSINHVPEPDAFARGYRAFHETASAVGAAVCLGGSALDAPLRSRLIAASFGDRVAHLVEFARRLVPTDRTYADPRETAEQDIRRDEP